MSELEEGREGEKWKQGWSERVKEKKGERVEGEVSWRGKEGGRDGGMTREE